MQDTKVSNDSTTNPSPNRASNGRARLIAVLNMWANCVVWMGVVKGLGIMLPTLEEQFDTQAWVIGWITSMITATAGLIGPFAGPISKRLGSRLAIILTGMMIGVTLITASFTQTPLQIAVILSLVGGTAIGVSSILVKESVGLRFDTNYATAIGVAKTGYSFGMFVFAPLIQLFLITYGWRGTMMLIGAISLHLVVCGALVTPPTDSYSDNYQQLGQEELSESDIENATNDSIIKCGRAWRFVFRNLELLKKSHYWLVVVMYCSTNFADDMWIIYFVSQALSNGLSVEQAATIVTAAGVANLISKIVQGVLIDKKIVSHWVLMFFFTGVTSTFYYATPWLTSYWAMMVSSCVVLFGAGCIACLNDVISKEVIEMKFLAAAYGWVGIVNAILRFSFGFIPGLLYDITGTYTASFLLIGSVQSMSLLAVVTLRCYSKQNDLK